MKIDRIIALLLVLFSASSGWADDLDLKTAIQESLSHSPEVQKYKSNVDEARWRKTESMAGLLPTVTGTANYMLAKKYSVIDVDFASGTSTIPQIFPTSQFLLASSLPLFDGLGNIQRYQSGIAEYSSAESEYAWTEFKTEMNTTLLFFRVLMAKNLLEVAQQNFKTVEDHLKDVNALRKVGIATKFDVLRIEVQKDEAQSEILKAEDEYEFAKINLAQNMGRAFDDRIPAGKFPVLSSELLTQFKFDSSNRQDLLALQEREGSLLHLQKSLGRFWVPNLALFGQVQAYNNINDDISDWDAYRNAYQLGLSLNWKIFDAAVSFSKYKQAKARHLEQSHDVALNQLEAEKDIQVWKRKFLYYSQLTEVRKAENEKAIESNRLASESLKAGTKTTTDLLDAELDLFKSRSDILNAQMGLIEALVHLQLATGQKIYDFTQGGA